MFMLMIVNQRRFLNVSNYICIYTYIQIYIRELVDEVYIVYQKTFLGCLDQSNDYNGYQCQTHRESYCFMKGNENWHQQFQFTCMNTCGFCESKCFIIYNMMCSS